MKVYKLIKSVEKIGKAVEIYGDEGFGKFIGEKIKDAIKDKSMLHTYGSDTVDIYKKINSYKDAQTPKYAY